VVYCTLFEDGLRMVGWNWKFGETPC